MKPWRRSQLDNRICGVTTLPAIGLGIVRRTFAFVALMFALLVVALILTGCATDGGRKPTPQMPPMPPKPSTSATASAIDSATVDASAAQQSVKAGRDKAKADDAPAAVPFLDKADSQLNATLDDLTIAKGQVTELEEKIKADREAHDKQAAAYESQIKTANAQIKKLSTEVAKLTNEVQRTAWRWMVGIGTLCLALSAAAIVAFFFSVFPAGLKVGPPLAAMGGMCLAVATMLSKIILAAQISVGVGFVFVLAYGAWHLWKTHRDTLNSVVAGVQFAKKNMTLEAVAALGEQLSAATSEADKSLIASIKQKLGLPS